MTGRVFDPVVVKAARDAFRAASPGAIIRDGSDPMVAALAAAADALEGAIRAEVLAPVAALAESSESDRRDVSAWLTREADQRVHLFPQRRDGIDALMREVAQLLSVIADPDAVAKHNAAVWRKGYLAADNGLDEDTNPYSTTEPTQPTPPERVADCGQDAICADNPWALCDRHKAMFLAWRDHTKGVDRG